jgi:tetratricopeptide (TPR) repeat protein
VARQVNAYYVLKFENAFLSAKGTAFQDLFVSIMSKAHPDDFIACKPWGRSGDKKNDGFLKSARTLFQVYAPNEMSEAEAVKKIDEDFRGALPYWREHFDSWVFVHNSRAGLPPAAKKKLLDLSLAHPAIRIGHWSYEELLGQFRELPTEAMIALYGAAPTDDPQHAAFVSKLNLAHDLMDDGKQSQAIAAMKEALSIARAAKNEKDESEVLVSLALSCSTRNRSSAEDYLAEAARKLDKVESVTTKILYFRARAASQESERDRDGAAGSLREAIACASEFDEERKSPEANQRCAARASLVHILCSEENFDEAKAVLVVCEAYARRFPDVVHGEVLRTALEAGIHYSVATADEDGVTKRIAELENATPVGRQAARTAEQLMNMSNMLSRHDSPQTALHAVQASIRLVEKCGEADPRFVVGISYTEAAMLYRSGDLETAKRKAQALLDVCRMPDDALIHSSINQLIAQIDRETGDSESAVRLAREALKSAGGEAALVAFAKMGLAIALGDNGQTEEALKQVREAALLIEREPPSRESLDIYAQMANYASQLGLDAVSDEACAKIDGLPDKYEIVRSEKKRVRARVALNQEMHRRLLTFPDRVVPSDELDAIEASSLAQANSAVVRQLVSWWDDILDSEPGYLESAYEAWGSEHLARLARNARQYPNSFNILLEVRSLADVKQAVRLWGLYADFLFLLWKGTTQPGPSKIVVPLDYSAKGVGSYILFPGTVLRNTTGRRWVMGLSQLQTLPREIIWFLATEARELIKSGRLIVVPASGVGCVNPGCGPFEQLFAEACNAIPNIRATGAVGTAIGNIPYSPDAPLELIAEIAEREADQLRKLRLLLLKRSRQLTPQADAASDARLLSYEINDVLRDLGARQRAEMDRKGLTNRDEPVLGSTTKFREDSGFLGSRREDSPYAPLFLLHSLGYGWRVEHAAPSGPAGRYEPSIHESIGHWLVPENSEWRMAVLEAEDADKQEF